MAPGAGGRCRRTGAGRGAGVARCGDAAGGAGRHRAALRVELAVGGGGVPRPSRARRVRRCAGVTSAGACCPGGRPWWQDYQPVSYTLTTRRGDRAGFAAMVSACHAAGVKVYADAVINHMAGGGSTGPGSAGSSFSHYDYPGTTYVRDRLAAYLNDLLSLGVDGFRIDAAKHMPATDIAAIESRLSRPAYVVQEVIDYGTEPIKGSENTGNGDVHQFPYGRDLGKIFRYEKLSYLRSFGSSLPSDKAVVFTDNHDTQRSGDPNILTFRDNGTYAMANAFMLAWTYGTPTVMSSYEYSSNDEGPPSAADGTTSDSTCFTNRWRCEHRWPVISNMVAFHNVARGTDVRNWWDNANDLIAFGRGTAGYLVVNDEPSAATGRYWQTSLPAGRYCDVFHGELGNGACTGPSCGGDSKGGFRADVAAHDGLALHIGARST